MRPLLTTARRYWRAVGLASLLLLPFGPVQAQPSLEWDTICAKPGVSLTVYGGSRRLSATRFLTLGWQDSVAANGVTASLRPILWLTTPRGRVIRRRVVYQPGVNFDGFVGITPAFGATYWASHAWPASPSRAGMAFMRLDSLGNTISDLRVALDTTFNWRQTALGVGADLLVTGTRYFRPRFDNFRAEVRRYNRQGNEGWRRSFGRWSYGGLLVPLRDGSYILHTSDPTRTSAGNYRSNYYYDHRIYKLTAGGDSLASSWVGTDSTWEDANSIKPTTDGGLIICGFESPFPYNTPRIGVLIKVDSLLQEQWRYRIYATCCDSENGAEIGDAWETADGHFIIIGGGDDLSNMREVIPPAGPGQPAPTGWRYRFPRLALPQAQGASYWLYESGNPAYGFGTHYDNLLSANPIADFYQARLTNLPAPAVLDYCRRPPRLDSLHWEQIDNRPDSLRFWLEAAETHPGPRYAELSLIEWDFGDGQTAEGWDVTHAYASPQPVRVRVCATNNVGCKVCRERFPYGPLSVRQEKEALVSVYPNPAPDGRFRLRGATGATATVLDAVGRVVLTQPGAEEDVVDLSSQPGGVYVLRLVWADGTTLVRRLVR